MYVDTPEKKDPDTYSRTLRDYHLFLWSKPLPNGKIFALTGKDERPYNLYHSSDLGDFRLSSDCFGHTYSKRSNMADIVSAVPKADIVAFWELAFTIGSYIIFPANIIDNRPTINGIRGMNRLINDRFDFTLECIRRWYSDIESPLSVHLNRYHDFFQLFEDFQGYVRFFLLDDLVDMDSCSIRFWLPFTDFGKSNPLPADVVEYKEYMNNIMKFINARNMRITEWAKLRR